MGDLQEESIPEPTEFLLLGDREYVVSSGSKLLSDDRREVLVEQELHFFNSSCSRRQASSASPDSVSSRSMQASISSRYSE